MRSSVFPNVNSLSCRHSPLLLPGCGELAPCDLAAHGCSLQPNYLGGESELLVGSYMFALFNESEQLGSHARTATLTSKPVSPVNLRNAFSVRRGCPIRKVHQVMQSSLCVGDLEHGEFQFVIPFRRWLDGDLLFADPWPIQVLL